MTTWTPAAHDELQRQLTSIYDRLARTGNGDGLDAHEVVEDLRRHVDQEFATNRVNVVTADDVKRVLTRIGLPEVGTDDQPATPPRQDTPPNAMTDLAAAVEPPRHVRTIPTN